MSAPSRVNSDDNISCSQPNISTSTPITNKRASPDSPDDLPATEKQEKRQIRRRNSISDLTDIIPKKAPSTRKTITDKVLEALTSPDVLNKIIPILSEKICETIEATIKDIVDDKIKTHVDAHVHPLIETVNKQQKTITEQAQTLSKQAAIITTLQTTAKDHTLALKEHSTEVNALYNKIIELESRIEGQEQYSRRTSLRFHNIKVPVDERGNVKHPVNTDELILNVCNDKLGLDINLHDIGRSHIIGKVKDGKSQVIVRFVSYRTRNKVYSNKKGLKNHPDKIFITENLTKYRTELVKQLAELKYNGLLYTYWTSDGRIFLKQNTTSRKILINNHDDILDFIHSTEHDTST